MRATMTNVKGEYEAYDDTEALFADAARMLECEEPSTHNESTDTPPDTGKTPTTHVSST